MTYHSGLELGSLLKFDFCTINPQNFFPKKIMAFISITSNSIEFLVTIWIILIRFVTAQFCGNASISEDFVTTTLPLSLFIPGWKNYITHSELWFFRIISIIHWTFDWRLTLNKYVDLGKFIEQICCFTSILSAPCIFDPSKAIIDAAPTRIYVTRNRICLFWCNKFLFVFYKLIPIHIFIV